MAYAKVKTPATFATKECALSSHDGHAGQVMTDMEIKMLLALSRSDHRNRYGIAVRSRSCKVRTKRIHIIIEPRKRVYKICRLMLYEVNNKTQLRMALTSTPRSCTQRISRLDLEWIQI